MCTGIASEQVPRGPRIAWAPRLSGLCLAVLGAGCLSEASVRDYLAHEEVCPPERIRVKKRPDLDPASFPACQGASPPPDVAPDPQRLAYWKATVGAPAANAASAMTVFEVHSCRQPRLIGCRAGHSRSGSAPPVCVWLQDLK